MLEEAVMACKRFDDGILNLGLLGFCPLTGIPKRT
jgi:hypothetical protein